MDESELSEIQLSEGSEEKSKIVRVNGKSINYYSDGNTYLGCIEGIENTHKKENDKWIYEIMETILDVKLEDVNKATLETKTKENELQNNVILGG